MAKKPNNKGLPGVNELTATKSFLLAGQILGRPTIEREKPTGIGVDWASEQMTLD